ncbi:MAG: peptidylprolyl isomerase [Sedimentisphaerales bacterium]|nr:peptidylprolyl isomerase [Sedimentisphaerales bacterium]
MKLVSRSRLLSIAAPFVVLFLSQASVGGMSSPAKTQKAQGVSANEIAVVVNGVSITEAEVDAKIKARLDKAGRQIPPDEVEENKKRIRPQVLEDMIVDRLLDKQVKKTGITVTDSDVNDRINEIAAQQRMSVDDYKSSLQSQGQSFEQTMEQVKKALVCEKLIGPVEVTDILALAFYEQNEEVFNAPERVRASHIFFKPDPDDPVRDRAKGRALIRAGLVHAKAKMGSNFGMLAQKNSEDAATSQKGGDLGFFARGTIDRNLEITAFRMKPGQLSEIIETDDGYHIIKVTDRKPAVSMSFEQAKPIIVRTLKRKIVERKSGEYIEKLKAEAKIVYPPGKEPREIPAPPPPAETAPAPK